MGDFEEQLRDSLKNVNEKITARRLLPIIVSFDTSGVMRPVRIQIDQDIYSVSMCYLASTGGPNVTYTCDVRCGRTHGTIDITYNKHDKKWYMEY